MALWNRKHAWATKGGVLAAGRVGRRGYVVFAGLWEGRDKLLGWGFGVRKN